MSSRIIRSNTLFLHIPKTGGTWIEHALYQGGVPIEQAIVVPGVTYRHAILGNHDWRFKRTFSFVRHPLSWYESWWKFQAGIWTNYEPEVWHPQRVLETCRSDDFSEFIRMCIDHEPGYVSRMYEWYIGPPGQQHVDYVGRFENLADDLIEILRALKEPCDEAAVRRSGRVNESRRIHGDPIWDPELRRRVLELESPAIRRFYPDGTKPGPGILSGRLPAKSAP